MNHFDKEIKKMIENEEDIKLPNHTSTSIKNVLNFLPEIEPKPKTHFIRNFAITAACFFVVAFVIFPNLSSSYAEALEDTKFIGPLVQVFTIRNYFYSDSNHEMNIHVPNMTDEKNKDSIDKINIDIDHTMESLVTQFYSELEEIGNNGNGSIYTNYETITNTNEWFTLKLSVNLVSGSGTSYFKYYNIDRKNDKIINLEDLFKEKNYTTVLSENIKEQMRSQMHENPDLIYWVDENFPGYNFLNISKDHNFYFNNNNDLVIPFDKFEVAPGSMGCPEFVINKSVIKDLLKDKYIFLIS